MKRTIGIVVATLVVVALAGRPAVLAQAPGPTDALTDPSLQAPAVVAFIGLKPGDRVADLLAGRLVRTFSQAVGAKGAVYATAADEVVGGRPKLLAPLQAIAADPAYANVRVLTGPAAAPPLPSGLDAVFIRQNYHDLHDKFMGPADMGTFNRNVYAALRPGGVFVVLDHAAAAGSGLRDTETLHRIDPAAVKAEVTSVGFVFDGQSAVLANPADDHSKLVFDPSVRGKTDQFLYRFKKPG